MLINGLKKQIKTRKLLRSMRKKINVTVIKKIKFIK